MGGLSRPTPPVQPPLRKESSKDSPTLDELLEISSQWASYFASQLESTNSMIKSTQSLPSSPKMDLSLMEHSAPAVLVDSASHSPHKAVHFNLGRGNASSEPCLVNGRKGVRLKFRQYNLSHTPETTV